MTLTVPGRPPDARISPDHRRCEQRDRAGRRPSVGAELHRRSLEGGLPARLDRRVVRDHVRAADLELTEQRAVLHEHLTLLERLPHTAGIVLSATFEVLAWNDLAAALQL